MILGTLRDQLLYPHNFEVSEEHVRRVLAEVNLAELPERAGGWMQSSIGPIIFRWVNSKDWLSPGCYWRIPSMLFWTKQPARSTSSMRRRFINC